MNNFTKEELQFISDYIYLGVRDKKNHELLTSVDSKIQSMINNYCEHTQSTLVNSCIICKLTNSYSIREFSEHLCNDCEKTFKGMKESL